MPNIGILLNKRQTEVQLLLIVFHSATKPGVELVYFVQIMLNKFLLTATAGFSVRFFPDTLDP